VVVLLVYRTLSTMVDFSPTPPSYLPRSEGGQFPTKVYHLM
jgi:hypothetical protein